eukprot:766345-Hanusia_phi.AAC.1
MRRKCGWYVVYAAIMLSSTPPPTVSPPPPPPPPPPPAAQSCFSSCSLRPLSVSPGDPIWRTRRSEIERRKRMRHESSAQKKAQSESTEHIKRSTVAPTITFERDLLDGSFGFPVKCNGRKEQRIAFAVSNETRCQMKWIEGKLDAPIERAEDLRFLLGSILQMPCEELNVAIGSVDADRCQSLTSNSLSDLLNELKTLNESSFFLVTLKGEGVADSKPADMENAHIEAQRRSEQRIEQEPLHERQESMAEHLGLYEDEDEDVDVDQDASSKKRCVDQLRVEIQFERAGRQERFMLRKLIDSDVKGPVKDKMIFIEMFWIQGRARFFLNEVQDLVLFLSRLFGTNFEQSYLSLAGGHETSGFIQRIPKSTSCLDFWTEMKEHEVSGSTKLFFQHADITLLMDELREISLRRILGELNPNPLPNFGQRILDFRVTDGNREEAMQIEIEVTATRSNVIWAEVSDKRNNLEHSVRLTWKRGNMQLLLKRGAQDAVKILAPIFRRKAKDSSLELRLPPSDDSAESVTLTVDEIGPSQFFGLIAHCKSFDIPIRVVPKKDVNNLEGKLPNEGTNFRHFFPEHFGSIKGDLVNSSHWFPLIDGKSFVEDDSGDSDLRIHPAQLNKITCQSACKILESTLRRIRQNSFDEEEKAWEMLRSFYSQKSISAIIAFQVQPFLQSSGIMLKHLKSIKLRCCIHPNRLSFSDYEYWDVSQSLFDLALATDNEHAAENNGTTDSLISAKIRFDYAVFCQTRKIDSDLAERLLRESISLNPARSTFSYDPMSPKVLTSLAMALMEARRIKAEHDEVEVEVEGIEHDFQEAIRLSEDAVALSPHSAQAHYVRGQCLEEFDGNFMAAKEEYEVALKLDPRHVRLMPGCRVYLYDLSEFKAAENCFHLALSIHPNNPPAQLHLAEIDVTVYNDKARAEQRLLDTLNCDCKPKLPNIHEPGCNLLQTATYVKLFRLRNQTLPRHPLCLDFFTSCLKHLGILKSKLSLEGLPSLYKKLFEEFMDDQTDRGDVGHRDQEDEEQALPALKASHKRTEGARIGSYLTRAVSAGPHLRPATPSLSDALPDKALFPRPVQSRLTQPLCRLGEARAFRCDREAAESRPSHAHQISPVALT